MLGLIALSIFAGYILASYFIVKSQKSKRKKIIAAIIMVLIPTWDVIIGRTIIYTLCATQGGIYVYETVGLGEENFDDDGVPLFYDRRKTLGRMKLANRYTGNRSIKIVSKLFNIKKYSEEILDTKHNKVLGEIKSYGYKGGWAFNLFNVGGAGGVSCPSYSSDEFVIFTTNIFKHVDAQK